MNDITNNKLAEGQTFAGLLPGEGEVAPQEATIFIAEDGSDHTITPGA